MCILYILLLARSERYAIIAMMERLEGYLSINLIITFMLKMAGRDLSYPASPMGELSQH